MDVHFICMFGFINGILLHTILRHHANFTDSVVTNLQGDSVTPSQGIIIYVTYIYITEEILRLKILCFENNSS